MLLDAIGFGNDGEILHLPPGNDPDLLAYAAEAVAERLRRICVRWLPASHPEVPTDALRIGSTTDGTTLHVARGEIGGGVQPGRALPTAAGGGFAAAYGGGSRPQEGEYWVLSCALGGGAVQPMPASEGRVPPNALVAGWEADGTPLYVALCPLPSFSPARPLGLVPGKVRPGLGGAVCAHAGQEHTMRQYFVLCLAAGSVLEPSGRPGDGTPAPPMRRFLVSIAELLAWSPSMSDPGVAVAAATAAAGAGTAAAQPQPQPLQQQPQQLDLRSSAPLAPPLTLSAASAAPARPRILHCHDMAGGYNELADETYLKAFTSWDKIDEFCYFGHHRVCIPPAAWVDACHAHGVPCYGTCAPPTRHQPIGD